MFRYKLFVLYLLIVNFKMKAQKRCFKIGKMKYPFDHYKSLYNNWFGVPFQKSKTPLPKVSTYNVEESRMNKLRCGNMTVDPESAILGGRTAKEKAWPWYVYIRFNTTRGICGGTLIDNQWVLTAAHCIRDRKIEYMSLGNIRRNNTLRYPMVSVVHEDYETNSTNRPSDIGMIKMNSPVTFSDYIQPICLPTHDMSFENNPYCYAMGFGMTNTNERKQSDTLQQIKVSITPQAFCRYTLKLNRMHIDSRHICTDKLANFGICSGDSGGPLCCKYGSKFMLTGIASLVTLNCGSLFSPDVFVRVSEFRDWIILTIGKHKNVG